jgi:hypothetical protein
MGLQGDMAAASQPGLYQRSVASKASTEPYTKLLPAYPTGGAISLSINGLALSEDGESVARLNVSNSSSVSKLPELNGLFDGELLKDINQINLNFNALSAKGFQSLKATVAGNIEVNSGLLLSPKSTLSLNAIEARPPNGTGNLTVSGDITSDGGRVTLNAARVMTLGDSIKLSTAGSWTNDSLYSNDQLSTNVAVDAGSISLQAHRIELGDKSTLNVSSGAWLNEFKKTSTGAPGVISLVISPNDPASNDGIRAGIQGLPQAKLYAYGFGAGGTLVLKDNYVNIASPSDLSTVKTGGLLLSPGFFNTGGFASFEISSLKNKLETDSGDLKVWSGAQILPVTSSWLLKTSFASAPGGYFDTNGSIGAAELVTYPLSAYTSTRPATTITLNAEGNLLLDTSANLSLDPQSTIRLLAGKQLTLLGGVTAPAGRILLALTSSDFDISRSIWLGPTAALNAPGSSQRIFTDSRGISRGEILDGGQVQIGKVTLKDNSGQLDFEAFSSANAYIVAQAGSTINVNGVGPVSYRMQSAYGIADTSLSSNAGSIDIQSSQGMLLDLKLLGRASSNARGGTLNLVLDSQFAAYLDPKTLTGAEEYARQFNVLNQGSNIAIVPKNLKVGTPILEGSDTAGWVLAGSKARSEEHTSELQSRV